MPVALEVHGTGFSTLSSVSFAGESVVPYATSATSFTIDVMTQTNAPSATLVVTLANGESDSIDIAINVVVPNLLSTTPGTLVSYAADTLSVIGTGLAHAGDCHGRWRGSRSLRRERDELQCRRDDGDDRVIGDASWQR